MKKYSFLCLFELFGLAQNEIKIDDLSMIPWGLRRNWNLNILEGKRFLKNFVGQNDL